MTIMRRDASPGCARPTLGAEQADDAVRHAGRCLPSGLTEILTGQSRWLFDLMRRRFLRCGLTDTVEAAVQFGSWRRFEHVDVLDARCLEIREADRPALRIEITRETRCSSTRADVLEATSDAS